ncbi:unnamed protein product [Bodo saltans]|uniref:Glycoside hydrolase family 5 C-terminal domain-containing protein n=1 Tax=Bodo saltans TaxID=75058 RepID=A0A0S4JNZ0_BODSA|nr:unnamed protein product [Bodo saltans]|eukprot:CUG92159.1 unnamed protein product [Bodo saltans]
MIRLKTSSVISSAPFIVAGLASFMRVQRRTVSHAGEHQQNETNQKQPRLPSPQEIAQGFSVLELSHTTITSFAEVRKKYYELAKVHHPDAVCPPIAAVAENVNLTGRATNEPMKPHEQLWHPASDPSFDKNSALRRQPSATELATDKMIRINNAFETLRRAHSAGILTTSGLDATFGKSSTTTAPPKSATGGPGWAWPFGGSAAKKPTPSAAGGPSSSANEKQKSASAYARMVRSDSSRRSLRFLYNEATPALRNPFIETKEEEAPNFDGFYYERSYAKIVAGRTITTRFDVATGYFMLTFQGEPFCESNVTRIVIHEELHYPFGFEVNVAIAPPSPQWMKTGENGDDIFHNVEGNRPKCPKKHFSDSNTRQSHDQEQQQQHARTTTPTGQQSPPLSAQSPQSIAAAADRLVRWAQPRRNLVEFLHDRSVIGLGRLQVTISIRPRMASV